MKMFLPYTFAALSLATPAMAQNNTNNGKCNASLEFSSVGTWYSEEGPRLSFDCKDDGNSVSGVYLPIGNDGTGAHDAHIKWARELPHGLVLDVKVERSENMGQGGGLIIRKNFGEDTSILVRGDAFTGGIRYVDAKYLSRHIDIAVGARTKNDLTRAYGYATANFGKWDDTFAFGIDADGMLWNNFTAMREKPGILEIAYYRPKTGNWGLETYMGRDDLPKEWFSREIDRLIPNNDILPKGRSFILAFPSYLVFGKTSGEIRAEWIGEKLFVNAGAGRRINLGRAKLGLGGGIEYTKEHDEVLWRPNGEIFIEVPIGKLKVSAQYRLRRNEGGLYATLSGDF